jgi:hypothetical protein
VIAILSERKATITNDVEKNRPAPKTGDSYLGPVSIFKGTISFC